VKRLGGRSFLAALFFGVLVLDGCSGHETPPALPVSADSSLVQDPRTTDASVVGAGATIDDAPPDVSGTYAGTIQDRTPQFSVDRGTIRLILHQTGAAVSGSIHIVNDQGNTASYTFTGSAAKTTKGAILQLSIADSSGRTVGVWAKVIGWTMFGKGWADPDSATLQSYEQLLFTMHKTAASTPTASPTSTPPPTSPPTASPAPTSNPTASALPSPNPISSPAPIRT